MSTNNMDRFEFRCIRPEETQQAIEIEQICFPPNEACSPKSTDRENKRQQQKHFW